MSSPISGPKTYYDISKLESASNALADANNLRGLLTYPSGDSQHFGAATTNAIAHALSSAYLAYDFSSVHVAAGATYAITGSDDTVTAAARSSVPTTGDRDAITIGGSGAAVTVMRAIPRRRGSRIRLRSRCCRTVPRPTAGTSRSAPGRASLPRSRPTPTLCKMEAK